MIVLKRFQNGQIYSHCRPTGQLRLGIYGVSVNVIFDLKIPRKFYFVSFVPWVLWDQRNVLVTLFLLHLKSCM